MTVPAPRTVSDGLDRVSGNCRYKTIINHGPRGGGGDWEVRAAVLQPAYGRGLVYASKAKCGQALGYYGGEAITPQEYSELHEDEGSEADP